MDRYIGSGGSSNTDQTITSGGTGSGTGSGSISWLDPSLRRRRFPTSPSSNAFLAPAFNSCAAATSDVDPTLLRYTRSRLHFSSSSSDSSDPSAAARRHLLHLRSSLRSSSASSPLSPIGNIQLVLPARSPPEAAVYKTPLKVVEVEEDVLVMDGVLVSESAGSNNRGRNKSAEFGSSGSSSTSSANSSSSLYKTEMCRSWEESGICRYGSKCQFAHGKEEVRGPRPWKQKTEVGGQSGKSVPSAGSCVYGNMFLHYVPMAGPTKPPPPSRPLKAPEGAITIRTAEAAPPTALASSEPSTFKWPPTEEEEALINQVLYGPSRRRRLPVFEEICPQ